MRTDAPRQDTLSQAFAEREIYGVSDCDWCARRSPRNDQSAGPVRLGFGESVAGTPWTWSWRSARRFTT